MKYAHVRPHSISAVSPGFGMPLPVALGPGGTHNVLLDAEESRVPHIAFGEITSRPVAARVDEVPLR